MNPARNSQQGRTFGYVLALVFVVLSAGRDVGGYIALLSAPVEILLLTTFVPTLVITSVVGISRGGGVKAFRWRTVAWDVLALNVTTAASWFATFEALSKIFPVTMATLTVGAIPAWTLVLDFLLRRRPPSALDVFAVLTIGFGVAVSIAGEPGGNSARLTSGIWMSLIASFFAAANNVFARRLNDRGMDAYAIFGTRFWLVVALTSVWVTLMRPHFPVRMTEWSVLIVLGLFGVACPLISLQMSIERIGPRLVGYLIALIPVVVVVIQWGVALGLRITGPSFLSSVGALVVCSGIAMGALASSRRNALTLSTAQEPIRMTR